MNREKRRLDDLLTIRENEIAQIRERYSRMQGEREAEKVEIQRKIEKMDYRYQKQLMKMKEDFSNKPVISKSHTSGKRSTVTQDTILIS
jgi:hypothetical protein